MARSSSIPKIRTDLAYYGVVTQVLSATSFIILGLVGFGDGAFVGYTGYVLQKADGTTTPPHQEQPAITGYTSRTGLFTHAGYTAPLAVGDRLLILHPGLGGVGTTRGLVYYGVVTAIPGANQFTIPTLAGFGDTAFVDWTAYVFWDTAGVDAAPQREQQAIATYDSATGIFSTGAFTAPVGVGDIILILHPRIADITTILTKVNDLISEAGLVIAEGTVTANWNTAFGTSGEAGEDLLGGASAQSAIPSKTLLHSLLLDVLALTDTALIDVKLFMKVNGNERKVYDQEFTVPTTVGVETPPPDTLGLWIVNGTLALHADLRVEVYSDRNELVAIGYTYVTGAIHA